MEYIEREAVLNAIKYAKLGGEYSVYSVVEQLPAADVRPVVLCKDCIHFQQFRAHDGFCQIGGMLWNNDFFCANGKRKES